MIILTEEEQKELNRYKPLATVRDIVKVWLIDNGYDGLRHESGCGCEFSDLAPCGEIQESCAAGHKVVDKELLREWAEKNGEDVPDWIIQ